MTNFMPHGYCMRWDFWLLVQHVASDFLIALAYFSIPAALLMYVHRRKDVNFGFLFWLFSIFIFSCGITHLFEIYVLWNPVYWWAGWAKVLTAAASVATAIVLWRVIPVALRIPTPQQLASANAAVVQQSKMLADAERGNKLKEDFLATLSHELRTPLNAILGWTELMESGRLAEDKSREAISIIRRNARAQAQLINDLLDLSAISSGKVSIFPVETNLVEITKAAVTALTPSAIAGQIEMSVRAPEPEVLVSGDAHRLQQVVSNLLTNSIKFTPPGGRIDVAIDRTENRAVLRVSDTGAGIARTFLNSVFDRFSQADGTISRAKGGLGIGLALAKELVVLHGGSIEAASEGEAQGSTFTVHLPVWTGSPTVPTSEPIPSEPVSLHGFRILVVDDEADSRELCAEICRDAGAEVSMAGSAQEALMEIHRRHPDAVISDIAMPTYDGLWLIRQIRVLPGCDSTRLPAIALSALARESDRQASLTAGFHEHMAKPMDPGGLLRKLHELLVSKS